MTFLLLQCMLSVESLHAGYGDLKVLHGVDLRVKSGEIVAIIGPNGSGKSTLLKSVFGLCSVLSGKILFKEKNIVGLPSFELIREGISFVLQGRQILSTLTVRENLEMAAFSFSNQHLVQKNLSDVFQKFPALKNKQKEYAFTLSGGQQQMLAIGCGLIQNSELLLLDEPSLGLSPKVMKEMFEKIQEINREGTAILLVEQNAKQAVRISNRTYVLENGQIALEGGKEIVNNPVLKKVYFGGP